VGKKQFSETEFKLPPGSKPGNLLSFEPSSATRNRFYVDAQSIAVGADGVVRYTLVIRSPSGAENVSFEGIRCETFEQKIYAYGRRDGTWSPVKTAEWRPIDNNEIDHRHIVLARDYFCPDNRIVKSPEVAIQRFKYPGPPAGGTRVKVPDLL